MGALAGIYRYPVKGLSAQHLHEVDLKAGRPFPFDRTFALARSNRDIDADDPKWAKKGSFLMLMLESGLAKARTHLDLASMRMAVELDGKRSTTLPIDTPAGKAQVEELFGRLGGTDPQPRLVHSRTGHFMDKPDNVLSLINLATIRDLEERWGTSLDPLRFRANFYIDGFRAWEEFDWIGREITIGDVVLSVDRRNGRCAATNVNPETGERDRDIPAALRTSFRHKDLGVYLLVKSSGRVTLQDPVAVQAGEARAHQGESDPGATSETMRYICGGCYYIYDGVVAGGNRTSGPEEFAALPADWTCPDCGSDKGKFKPYDKPTPASH